MLRFLVLSLSISALFSPTAVFADGPGYKLCNNSGKTYAVSYLYRDGLGVLRDSWTWTGYFLLKPRSCGYHLPTHNAAHIFLNLHILNSPSTLGPVVRLGPTEFTSSNGTSEIGEREFCTYATGKNVTKPIAGHKQCASMPLCFSPVT